MKSQPKIGAMIIGIALGIGTFAGSAMALDVGEVLKQIANATLPPPPQGLQPMAKQLEEGKIKPTQVIAPKDKRVAAAMDEALPTIKQVLSIHQCIQEPQSLLQLNVHAVPGVNMMRNSGDLPAYGFPNSQLIMKFHDRNKCVSLTTIDQWSMPALNALLFRAVYFADDSGETVNFLYLFKKVDDGSWKIAQLERGL